MSELIALRAVFGQDEANHGTRRYRVGGDGLVHVSPEAVAFLVSKGGFALPKTVTAVPKETRPAAAAPIGLVRLHHDDARGCSYAGCEYHSDANSYVSVPAEAAANLVPHGFIAVSENDSQCGVETVSPGPAVLPLEDSRWQWPA
jgi:hypothetical protein